MMYSFVPSVIHAHLKELDETRRIAFGVFLLERALPSYFQFQADSGGLGGAELRAALAQCWAALEAGSRDGAKFVTVEACEEVLPDSENYTSIYTSAAIDAANIACCLLSYLDSGDLSNLMEAVQARWDTLYLFILNGTGIDPAVDGFQQDILHHHLMQEELRLLHDDIAYLQAISGEGPVVLIAAIERVNQLDYRRLRLKL
ncbi:DUF416 family protein [Dyella psychrodurans]|uniref:DUF416 family protein n=1 Tax=Dyella psychrodurans TaxID=1927960 RepID=A0A370X144_9GAMM|nr:DUF416 family protein [Dyella psychrodurans]RDS81981.1 DUF416 family protein [Dyella psychrodurans]